MSRVRYRSVIGLMALTFVFVGCTTASSSDTSQPPPTLTTTVPLVTTTAEELTIPTIDGSGRLVNVAAFGRLVNYVRFFHPSDEAADADWGRFVIDTVDRLEQASDPDELADLLGQVIKSVAPSVVVYPISDPPLPADRPGESCSRGQVVAWEHRGVNTAEVISASSYSSERVVVDADRTTWPDWYPDPSEPFRVDLGGGVGALVPLAVCVANGVTVPEASGPDWSVAQPPLLSYERYPRDAPETRLAAVILTWGFFQHFYPYWDVVDSDWSAALDNTLALVWDQPEMPLIEVLRRFLTQTRDGHALVTGGSEDLAIPPIQWAWIEKRLVITDVRGTARGSLQAGDTVITIDGVPVAGALEDAEQLVANASPQQRRMLALMGLLEGPWGSTIDLELETPDRDTATASLKRTMARVSAYQQTEAEPRPDPIAIVAQGVAYLDLTRVTEADVESRLEMVENAERLVVDLRGYPTGTALNLFPRLLAETVSSDRYLLPITTRPDGIDRLFEDVTREYEAQEPRLASEIVFLTDTRAMSAAETIMGIVETHKVGEIVGSPTAGTNGSVVKFVVPGGFTIRMTGLKVTNPDGTPHHGVGVQPTVFVERTIDGVIAGTDELLTAAIHLLSD